MVEASVRPPTEVHVRPMGEGERRTVRAVMRRAFPPLAWLFFSWKRDVLVAEHDGRIIGGVVLDTFPLPRGRQGGFFDWIFTDPQARGLGVGQRLTEAALELFAERGCDEVTACVEGYNTSSSKLFATRGFDLLSPGEQLRRYGLATPLVWWRMFHLPDIGHFVWARPGAVGKPRPALQWVATAVLSVAIMALALWRQSAFGRLELPWLAASMVAVPVLYGLRYAGMRLAARAQGIRTEFRMWESAMTLGLGLALVLGQWYPVPGSLYPEGDRWRYHDMLPRWAPVALAGVLPVLLVGWTTWGALRWANLSPAVRPWVQGLHWVAGTTAFFDGVMAFFPFASYNARRLWDRSRLLWLAVAVPAAVLLFV